MKNAFLPPVTIFGVFESKISDHQFCSRFEAFTSQARLCGLRASAVGIQANHFAIGVDRHVPIIPIYQMHTYAIWREKSVRINADLWKFVEGAVTSL